MSYVRVWIHAGRGTEKNAKAKEIYIDRLNGSAEHLHCLFALNADMTIANALQLITGESAHWINKEGLTKFKFEWADEYYAVSVSESALDKVRQYIGNQEVHHKRKTYGEEVEELMEKYKFERHG